MKRRSFLASLAAMTGFASGMRLGYVADDAVRYDLFLGNDGRYSLAFPFSLDGHVYATDSRILIRHADTVDRLANDGSLPPVSSLWWDAFEQGGWKRIERPKVRLVSDADTTLCLTCMGTGRSGSGVHRCSVCKADDDNWGLLADGTIGCSECHYGWCGGDRCPDCKLEVDCDGAVSVGWADRLAMVEFFDGGSFDAAMMQRVRTLPGEIEFKRLPPVPRYRELADVVAFRWGNTGQGFLMGWHP